MRASCKQYWLQINKTGLPKKYDVYTFLEGLKAGVAYNNSMCVMWNDGCNDTYSTVVLSENCQY